MERVNEDAYRHPKDMHPQILSTVADMVLTMRDSRIIGTEEEIQESIIAIVRALGPQAYSRNIMPVLRHFYSNEPDFRTAFAKMWGYQIAQEPGQPWQVVADKRKNEPNA